MSVDNVEQSVFVGPEGIRARRPVGNTVAVRLAGPSDVYQIALFAEAAAWPAIYRAIGDALRSAGVDLDAAEAPAVDG